MASELFDLAADVMADRSSLSRLESRGTLRLVLKSAGLDAGSLTLDQLRVVFARRMPDELRSRGVEDAEAVARSLWQEIERSPVAGSAGSASTIDDTFRRLGSG